MTPFFDDGQIKIYCADALDYLKSLDDNAFDLCLTDPPYGIGIAKKGAVGGGKGLNTFKPMNWDAKRPPKEYFDEIQRVSRFQIIWGGNYFADWLKASRCWLVWHKRPNNKTGFADCEMAWTSMDANARVLVHEWNGFRKHTKEDRFAHPTQKPMRLMAWCISQLHGEVKTIIDPFMGTGTTLKVAKDLGLRAVGIDREEPYCEIGKTRLLQQSLEVFEA